jgi:murein DD-endopeptidase MepM/ murein hydrolase activator NlpD
MYRDRRTPFIAAIILVLSLTDIASAHGVDLSFPAAILYGIRQGFSSSHQAIDYLLPSHTQVAAARQGTVVASYWGYDDNMNWYPCVYTNADRGNYIILDHGSGNQTWYHHLSKTGGTPTGGSFFRGQAMALSDNTGCSTGNHLHFAVIVNGTATDPYAGTTQWVSGAPIAMGYSNQGPFQIVFGIEAKWVSNEGGAGSPMNVEHCPSNSPGVPWSDDGVVQDFTNNSSRIMWSSPTGTHWVYGAISAKYIDVGGPWPNPAPGYPTSDEYQWGTYRRTDFDRGYITWRSDQGAVWNYGTYTARSTCHWGP